LGGQFEVLEAHGQELDDPFVDAVDLGADFLEVLAMNEGH
jgi:hypothetical protein